MFLKICIFKDKFIKKFFLGVPKIRFSTPSIIIYVVRNFLSNHLYYDTWGINIFSAHRKIEKMDD